MRVEAFETPSVTRIARATSLGDGGENGRAAERVPRRKKVMKNEKCAKWSIIRSKNNQKRKIFDIKITKCR